MNTEHKLLPVQDTIQMPAGVCPGPQPSSASPTLRSVAVRGANASTSCCGAQVQKHASDYYEASWGPVRELIRETPDGLGGGQALTLTREKVRGLA